MLLAHRGHLSHYDYVFFDRLPLLTNEIRGVDKLVPFSEMLVNSSYVDEKKAEGIEDTKGDQ